VVINVCGLGTTCTDATVASVSTRKCAALILNTNPCSNINNNVAPLANVGFSLESSGIPYLNFGGCSISQGNMWNGYRLRDNRNYAIVAYDSNSQYVLSFRLIKIFECTERYFACEGTSKSRNKVSSLN